MPHVGPGASSALRTGGGAISTVPLQQICPTNMTDHFAIGSYDAVGYAVVLDALDHPGPAVPSRISPAVCLQPFMPGVDPATFVSDDTTFVQYAGNSDGDAAKTSSEPALKPYVFARR